jgi:regulator of replication initiation timing
VSFEQIDLDQIQDVERAKGAIVGLLNSVEDLQATVRQLQAENQRLRDEINHLKGEQGKPDIKPNRRGKQPGPGNDHSSEAERRKPQAWHKGSKLAQIKIDREEVLTIDPARLPADAEFKGYEDSVVQDVVIQTDNVLYRKEKYYSPSEHRTYLAELPPGYTGQFGPGLKALALVQYYACNMAEPKIREFFANVGILISEGELSNWLIKDWPDLHAEKAAIYEAGLRSSPWQHLDDTATRVNGDNQHCHVVCNPLYTAFFTTASKDRLTILDVLRNLQVRTFRVNAETIEFLHVFGLSQRIVHTVHSLPQNQDFNESEMSRLLDERLPHLGPQQRVRILEAAAVAAYHAQPEFPVVKLLVCDDAPQFNWVTAELALCWVHEGRHYKKLAPCISQHRAELDKFTKRFWAYYDQLLSYRKQPGLAEKARLADEFDLLFSTVTAYRALDERIEKTKLKKASLLMVLDHPEIPLHNNPAELGARQRVRKRDVSFGPRTQDGAKAWDTFMTLTATAKKLGVSIYHYIHDRVSGAFELPDLADTITQRAAERSLGASWGPAQPVPPDY